MTTTTPDSTNASKSSRPSSRRSTSSAAVSKPLVLTALIASVVALAAHGYLMNEHYVLRYGQASAQSLCNINELFNCSAVSASKYSEFLNIPMALWGFLANTVLVLLLGWFMLTSDDREKGGRNVLLVSGFIALTSIVMGSISFFLISKLCLFCMGAYLLSFITFGCLWFGLRGTVGSGPRFAVKDFSPVLILAVVAFASAFIMNDKIRESFTNGQSLDPMIQEALETWKTGATLNIQPVAPLVMGASDANAKMIITEFADFRCIHCKHAGPVLKAFVSANPDVQLRFEAWPLDSECNAGMPSAPNHASCLLARAVNCAESLKHTGWKAHEYVYDNQDTYISYDAVKGALPKIAEAVGVAPAEMQTCVDSEDSKKQISSEAAVGTALNLQGTPSIYVNNKKLPYGQFLPILAEVHKEIQATH